MPNQPNRPNQIPIVIDTDIGADPDDAIALALACASPELNLLGVTTVDGDVGLRARMAAHLLGMAGRSAVPVVPGLSIRGTAMMGLEGRGLLDHEWAGPEASILTVPAPEWLVETSWRTPFHLVAIGPLTNVAAACRLDPEFAGRLLGLTIMGGLYDETALPDSWRRAIADQGSSAWPDYNTMVDPAAALVCAESGATLTWVTSEVTHQIPLRRAARASLPADRPLTLALGRMIDSWYDGWFRRAMIEADTSGAVPADTHALLHDPLTLASLLPMHEDWLTLRDIPFRYAVEDGIFRMYETSCDSGSIASVSTAAESEKFAAFCLERIVRRSRGTGQLMMATGKQG